MATVRALKLNSGKYQVRAGKPLPDEMVAEIKERLVEELDTLADTHVADPWCYAAPGNDETAVVPCALMERDSLFRTRAHEIHQRGSRVNRSFDERRTDSMG